MSKKNAINNRSGSLTIDPGAAGDSFLQLDINTTGEFRIGVDDTDDSFRISQGSALGTNDTFVMTAAGERTMPLQPAFLADLRTQDSDETGDATTFQLGSGNALTEVFDQGADFNTNGTFTAPITGRYYLHASIIMNPVLAAHTTGEMRFITSNATYYCAYSNAGAVAAVNDTLMYSGAAFVDMDASDTATVELQISGSTKTIDLLTNNRDTSFAGFLVC